MPLKKKKLNVERVVICGLGEIGYPILEICREKYHASGVDLKFPESLKLTIPENENVKVLHICIPGNVVDFVDISVGYIKQFNPELTIINSSVIPGTTRKIFDRTRKLIVHSPVQGKHKRNMPQEIKKYDKQVGPISEEAYLLAKEHFEPLGVKTIRASKPEASEWQKLLCTTAFGLFIAWAQELERICDEYDLKYDELTVAYRNPDFNFPHYSGVIGGHCVMPNIELIKKIHSSDFLDIILQSNNKKILREKISQDKSSRETIRRIK